MWKHWSRRMRRSRYERLALGAVRELQADPMDRLHWERWVDLSLTFPIRGDVRIRTVQRRPEILGLVHAVAALQPARILEIGTYRGGTFLLWAQLATRQVVSCDLDVSTHLVDLYERFPPDHGGCEAKVLLGDTHTDAFAVEIREALDGPVDFLFLDGDHREAGIREDYERFRGLVRPGGLIAFHDVVPSQPLPENQVHRFWEGLVAATPDHLVQTFIEDPAQCGFGIGCVTVPEAGS